MADSTYRANLSAKTVPIDPLLFGRSVIMKGNDSNYAPNLASKLDTDKDIGLPQVLYIANCLPTEYGYASMSFYGDDSACPHTPYLAFPVRSATESATLVHTTEGFLYRLRKESESDPVPRFVPIGYFPGTMTYAHVSGTTYIYVANVGCYSYDFVTGALVPEILLGLTASAILGLTATGGYLLAWSEDAIAWSSLLDPTDFVPSLDTGAGGGSVEGAKGALTVCVSNSTGIYVFTATNCISAQLSNNARYPFNFKEILGSAGLSSVQSVSYEGNQNSAYAFTTSGFQQITHQAAKTLWTELHENGLTSPIWDENTVISGSIVQGKAGKIPGAKLATIASKYVCVSIPHPTEPYFTQIWIYDLALDKWGRLVKDHRDVFETEEFRIGIMTRDNRYVWVDSPFLPAPSVPRDPDVAYLAAGRFQHTRSRVLVLQAVELENLYPRNIFNAEGFQVAEDFYPEVFNLASLDGKSGAFAPVQRVVKAGGGDEAFATYKLRKTGVNHTVMLKGYFKLNTLLLTYSPGGGR